MRSTILPLAASIALAPAVFAVEAPATTLAKAEMPAAPGMAAAGGEMMAAGKSQFSAEQIAFFESKVRPVLASACYKCHSLAEGKAKGGLTVDTAEGLKKGGDNGPAVVPGDPSKSSLITAITYNDPDLQMPPKGEKLKDEDIKALTEWVQMGAPDPRTGTAVATKLTGLTDKARMHWAFKPVTKPALPEVKANKVWTLLGDGKTQHPVDTFVLAKLEEKGMLPSPPADRDTLLRRASYDLLGLPPSPQEMKAFREDTSPDAWAKVIDRMLASPHYGERWGRYWLNTARYADTIGGDQNNNNRADYRYPFAWTYRDWVVKSINQDMPYDKFVMFQLAADKMPESRRDPRLLSALGFLTVGERFGNANDEINDRIDVTTKGFLGLTVSCARCHDHMFDPIPTKDYYALHGVFSSIEEPDEKPQINNPSSEQMSDFQNKMSGFEQKNREEYYRVMGEFAAKFRMKAGKYLQAAVIRRDRSEAGLKKLEALQTAEGLDVDLVNYLGQRPNRMDNDVFSAFRKFAALSESDFGSMGAKLAAEIASSDKNTVNPAVAAAFKGAKPQSLDDVAAIYTKLFNGIDGQAKQFFMSVAKTTSASFVGVEDSAARAYAAPFPIQPPSALDSDSLRELTNDWPLRIRNAPRFTFGDINKLYLTHPGAPAKAMVVADKSSPVNSPVFIRGAASNRGDVVPRRFLDILSPGGRAKEFSSDDSGRLELAKAIASKDNSLTARVMVNRVWLNHFGEGFVRTPDDLGTQSEAPSHPELLDYLSSYFMENNWSLKALHRVIMTSKTYQLSSHTHQKFQDIDPENRYLWRANVRRLDFESIRDSLLVYAGNLDRTVGGKPVNLTDEPYSRRRSVYGYIDRGNLPELLMAFDFSDPDMPNSKRTTSIVPQQALFLMNSSMAVDAARRIIARPEVANAPDGPARVMAIHNIIFQRDPKKDEIAAIYEFLNRERNMSQFIDDKARKAMAAAAEKKNEELEKKLSAAGNNMREQRFGAIQNEGEIVDRRPLNEWETYAQALLLSNEAVYVN